MDKEFLYFPLQLAGVFDVMSGFGKVVVLSFLKGSIGVDVAVIYDPTSPVTQADVQSTLDESITTGDFLMGSDLKIASSDVKVIEGKAKHVSPVFFWKLPFK